jgi:hypothetical protein
LSTRTIAVAIIVSAALAPTFARADAYDDLIKIQTAFLAAKSWHAEELFSNGKTVVVEYSAPDRWREQPNPDSTEVIIGNDIYMIRKGKSTKLPFGGDMIRKTIQNAGFSVKDDVRATAKDLGMQTLDGHLVHAYSYTVRDTPATIYVGPGMLPIQTVVQDKKGTTTIKYSKFNEPITIEAP